MKKLLTSLFLLLSLTGYSQSKTITYSPTDEVITNPERGFTKLFNSNYPQLLGYESLNEGSLLSIRLSGNISLIQRTFYLENFINSPISQSYLGNIQTDLDRIRNAGLKVIIRFAYSNEDPSTTKRPKDASKARILEHISQLKPILQKNGDVICLMKAGFIGTWGEWYYTDQAEFGIPPIAPNITNRKAITDALLDALPSNRMIQLRTPAFKRNLYSPSALPEAQAFNQTPLARIGHHNDCFLASSTDYGTYTSSDPNTNPEYSYLANETMFLPMGGETCAVNVPRSECPTAIAEMEKFHWSFLSNEYHPDVLGGWKRGENCFPKIENRLGYRFQLNSATFPEKAGVGGTLIINLKIENKGFAAPFNERKAYIVLKNTSNNKTYSLPLTSDPRKWLKKGEIVIEEHLNLPIDIPVGNYNLFLHLPDASPSLANRSEYAIRFANQSIWDGSTGYNNLNHTIQIAVLPLEMEENNILNLSIYPMPADNEIFIEMDGIKDYQITLNNSLGQDIKVGLSTNGNRTTLDTKNIAGGVYFLKIRKDSVVGVRKIIIQR